jgi:hypothetical protein
MCEKFALTKVELHYLMCVFPQMVTNIRGLLGLPDLFFLLWLFHPTTTYPTLHTHVGRLYRSAPFNWASFPFCWCVTHAAERHQRGLLVCAQERTPWLVGRIFIMIENRDGFLKRNGIIIPTTPPPPNQRCEVESFCRAVFLILKKNLGSRCLSSRTKIQSAE